MALQNQIPEKRPRDHRGHFRKRAIRAEVRRELARRYGCEPLGRKVVECHYCSSKGEIFWITASWVTFADLEMDHIIPEFRGGSGECENLVLACRSCNRSKGAKHA
jgi:5-methylcytosine-specific restriction endonuclease McrA